jgi:hypothetical protein
VRRAGANATLLACVAIGLVLVGAVALGGTPVFRGPIWAPGLTPQTMPPVTNRPQPTMPPLPKTEPTAAGTVLSIVFLVLGIAAALFVAFLVYRIVRAKMRSATLPPMVALDDPLPVTSAAVEEIAEVDAPVVRHGLERALDELEQPREPSDAVVKAWLGLQEAAEVSGVQRRGAETPTEFTTRVLTRVHADEGAARALVDVYQSVRFGSHPITAEDVAQARDAVTRLLASWHEPVVGRVR